MDGNNGAETPAAPERPGQVAPYHPLSGTSRNEIELQTNLLKTAIDTARQSSRLSWRLESINLDPRDRSLTVKYSIPHMQSLTGAKQGLLFAGFEAAWAAFEQNRQLTKITLIGYAYAGQADTNLSLGLITDVRPQQAESAHGAGDYRALATFLDKPMWRDDLESAPL